MTMARAGLPDPVQTAAPAELPVTLAELKSALRYDANDLDDYLEHLIGLATAQMDGVRGFLGRAIVTQDWAQDFFGWIVPMRLPMPATEILEITYSDASGASQSLDVADFDLVTRGVSWITPKSSTVLPTLADVPCPVRVAFRAGFGGAAQVPIEIKGAIMVLAAAHFDGDAEAIGKAALQAERAVLGLRVSWL